MSLGGSIQHFVLLQNSKYCQRLSDLGLEVAAIRTISSETASALFVCSVPCSMLILRVCCVQTISWPLIYFMLAEPSLQT